MRVCIHDGLLIAARVNFLLLSVVALYLFSRRPKQVRDVYSQLAVALELLAARESELQEADNLVQHHEASLAEVRVVRSGDADGGCLSVPSSCRFCFPFVATL